MTDVSALSNRLLLQKELQYPKTKPLTLSDIEIITAYADQYSLFSCEYSFANLYLWNDIYQYRLAFFKNLLIIIDPVYDFILMPLGENIRPSDLITLSKMLKKNGYSGNIANIPPAFIGAHAKLSLNYAIENIRDEGEYIYSTQALFTLSGKKLRKKRNHISQFIRQYPHYQVKAMNASVRKDCFEMAEKGIAERQVVSKSIQHEMTALKKALHSFTQLPLEGIAIYSGDKDKNSLICFSIYSRLNRDVFTIHFEKADYAYPGAAQIINQQTAKQLIHRCQYINREQDLGIEGLRKAKLSYDPEFIYPAYFLTFLE